MSGRKCAYCESENREEAKYCDQCGRALTEACPNCHYLGNPVDSRFCCQCGVAYDAVTSESTSVVATDLSPEQRATIALTMLAGDEDSAPATTESSADLKDAEPSDAPATADSQLALDNGALSEVQENSVPSEAATMIATSDALDNTESSTSSESVTSAAALTASSVDIWSNPIVKTYAELQVGDRFYFGSYMQEADARPKPIEWLVIKRNSNSLAVIAQQAIFCRQFHTKANSMFSQANWKLSSLRKWLNKEFLAEAFHYDEQACILQFLVIDDEEEAVPGQNDTNDRIFLLSRHELEQIWSDNSSRICEAGTLALSQNCAHDSSYSCRWWLRSAGTRKEGVHIVAMDGQLDTAQPNLTDIGVRPVLMLTLKA